MATWAARHENLHTIGHLARRGRWRPALPGRWHPRDCDCYICYI